MSFLDFIEKLQNRPKEVRFRIFIGLMIFSAIIVFIVFLVSAKRSFRHYDGGGTLIGIEIKEDLNYKKPPSVIDSIKSSVLEVLNFSDKAGGGGGDEILRQEETGANPDGKKLPAL